MNKWIYQGMPFTPDEPFTYEKFGQHWYGHLIEEVKEHGEDFYHREILHICKTKGECAYMETKEQFEREVLLTDDYYNGIINCRIGSNSVKNMFTK
jgi:hypothetical protein